MQWPGLPIVFFVTKYCISSKMSHFFISIYLLYGYWLIFLEKCLIFSRWGGFLFLLQHQTFKFWVKNRFRLKKILLFFFEISIQQIISLHFALVPILRLGNRIRKSNSKNKENYLKLKDFFCTKILIFNIILFAFYLDFYKKIKRLKINIFNLKNPKYLKFIQ